ncbi:MAG: hypothetical protein ACXWI5_06750, partial [Croceibacterium sp.]
RIFGPGKVRGHNPFKDPACEDDWKLALLEATLLNEADPPRELKIKEECVLVAEKLVTHHWSLRRRSSISCSDKPGPPP